MTEQLPKPNVQRAQDAAVALHNDVKSRLRRIKTSNVWWRGPRERGKRPWRAPSSSSYQQANVIIVRR